VSSVVVEALEDTCLSAKARGHEVLCEIPIGKEAQPATLSPPEYLLSALGFCIGLYVERYCMKQNISMKGMKLSITSKSATNPSRIGKILFEIDMPIPLSEKQREGILAAAKTCYLHNTLLSPPDIDIILK
jgi:uncharacterized OsmC-like protein